ncbi:MAG: glycosyltransferase family 4 protein [Gammaproteobacteria bacterium]|nr:glycosyltransferase family 4 protein [Gammaproteobacteria bacterium]
MTEIDRENDPHSALRVCLVGPTPGAAGGQSVVAEQLLLELNKLDGVRADLLPIDPQFPRALKKIRKIKYLRTLFNSIIYFYTLLSQIRRYHVVHIMSASYWSYLVSTAPAILVARLYRRPIVLNYHSGEADDHLANWRTAKPLAKLADVIAVPSAYLQEVFSRHGLDSVVVANFVDGELFSYRRRTALQPVLLCNRSFQAHYNVACVVDAFHLIQQQHENARLTLAGDGPLRSRLREQVNLLKLANVRFAGAVSMTEMARLYDEADIYINASMIDNMPMSLLEAAVSGLPIVSSDAGGIPYMVQDGREAMLVPSGEAASLARAALNMLDGQVDVDAMTDAAYKLVKDVYSPVAVVGEWRRTYRHALGDKDPHA